jgi:hypothetical protein
VSRAAAGAAVIALFAAAAAGCDRGPRIDTCTDSLSGQWRDAEGHAWGVIDQGARIEAYPTFTDTAPPPGAAPGLEIAPRVIDFQRAGAIITGVVHRRFMSVGKACDPAIPVRVVACRARTLELELGDPPAPTSFAPCAFPPVPPPAATRWTWEAPLR